MLRVRIRGLVLARCFFWNLRYLRLSSSRDVTWSVDQCRCRQWEELVWTKSEVCVLEDGDDWGRLLVENKKGKSRRAGWMLKHEK